eukprot:c2478_g1_i1.p1 GENE.c2478_g1_i1~~c2478_g1_i1.p1  ORF type:complete len:111 (-),score=1.41 c2478_g1_i1:79-411(-)
MRRSRASFDLQSLEHQALYRRVRVRGNDSDDFEDTPEESDGGLWGIGNCPFCVDDIPSVTHTWVRSPFSGLPVTNEFSIMHQEARFFVFQVCFAAVFSSMLLQKLEHRSN